MANTLIFFVEKNVSNFCIGKATPILQQKYQYKISVFENTLYEIEQLRSLSLTSFKLTSYEQLGQDL